MTALPLAPNALKLKITGKIKNSPCVHILHAQYSGGTPTSADVTAVAAAMRGFWNTRMAPLISPNVSYSTFEVTDLASLTGATFTNTTSVNGTRSDTGLLTLAACAVISWKTDLRFRGGHCRTYFPLTCQTDAVQGQTLATSFQTSLNTAAFGFLTDFNGITSGTLTFKLAMLSYFSHRQVRPIPQLYLITSAPVHNRIDTQRRRLGKADV